MPINFLNHRDELSYVLKQSDGELLIIMDRFCGLDFVDELAPGRGQQGEGPAFRRRRQVVAFPAVDTPARAGVTTLDSLGADSAPLTSRPICLTRTPCATSFGPWVPPAHPGA